MDAEVPATIRAQESERGVLDDQQATLPGECDNGIHLTRDSGIVDDHDRPGPRRDRLLDPGSHRG